MALFYKYQKNISAKKGIRAIDDYPVRLFYLTFAELFKI